MDKELFSEIKDEEFKYPLYANALEKEGLLGYYKESKYVANSITITARGNIGHSIVRKSDFNAIGRLIILNSKKELNNDFFSEYINSNLKFYIESTGVPQLTAPSLKINKVKYPTLDEQNKISNFILAINKKIELLEKKYEKYISFKKYLMNFIFSEEYMFKMHEYKTFKLGEISKINTGKKDVKDKKDNGKYPFFVRSEKIEKIDSYSFDGEAILIPGDGKIGEVYHYINGKFDYHQRVYKISNFNEHTNGKYVFYFAIIDYQKD